MSNKTKDEIKAFFQTGDQPVEAQFIDLIDSYVDKSGPLGTLETQASAGANGVCTFSGGTPQVRAYDLVRDSMGITVYTTAQVSTIIGSSVVTSAQASAIAADAIASAYTTTAAGNAGTATTGIMNPVLVKNAISSLSVSGWIPIKTLTAASDATIDFVNGSGGVVLDGTYKAYAVVISDLVPATDNSDLYMRTSTNAGVSYDAGASDYDYGGLSVDADASINLVAYGNDATTEIKLITSAGNDTGESSSVVLYLFNPAAATFTKVKWEAVAELNSGAVSMVSAIGRRVSAADVDAIRFLMSSGNITSGTFTLYGLKSAS